MSMQPGDFAKYAERVMKKEAIGGGAETAATIDEFTRTLPLGNFVQDLPDRALGLGGIPGYLASMALVPARAPGAALKRDLMAVPGALAGETLGRGLRGAYRRLFGL